ncbi:MAG: hypothetical protein KAS40_16540, partial [Desulfobacterales bacterium]|nr:hypothetical protein [Desulfobacterales bacterium]
GAKAMNNDQNAHAHALDVWRPLLYGLSGVEYFSTLQFVFAGNEEPATTKSPVCSIRPQAAGADRCI